MPWVLLVAVWTIGVIECNCGWGAIGTVNTWFALFCSGGLTDAQVAEGTATVSAIVSGCGAGLPWNCPGSDGKLADG